jgi:hypothetical protein
LLLNLTIQWYFAGTQSERDSIHQQADNIRAKANDGVGWWLDHAKQFTEAACDVFSVSSASKWERDELLGITNLLGINVSIDDTNKNNLQSGMFIASLFTPSGEGRAAANAVKSWIKHDVYNEVRNKFGKEGVEKFINAMKKGIVGAEGENGIKLLSGKGVEIGDTFYKYEIKIKGKMGDWQIYGNMDDTGRVIFNKFDKGSH